MSLDPSMQISNPQGYMTTTSQGLKRNLLNQKLYRGTRGNQATYLTFKERVEQSPYLVSLEDKTSQNLS